MTNALPGSSLIMAVDSQMSDHTFKQMRQLGNEAQYPEKMESFDKVMDWLKHALTQETQTGHSNVEMNIEQCSIEPVRNLANEIMLEHSLSNIAALSGRKRSSWDYKSLRLTTSSAKDSNESNRSESGFCEEEGEICFGCGQVITERYLLKVSGRAWHITCLQCSVCGDHLDRHTSCYVKEDTVYCKTDYSRQFGTKCAKCMRHIQSTDWVRHARNAVYHLACFSCDACKRQLSTGEEFALQDDKVLCKTHYIEIIEGGTSSDEGGSSHKPKTKRVRTTFTEEQIQVLQANFQLDSNPDGQDLERIAQITGLSKRVTQVWFQNSRARQKKHQQSNTSKHNALNNMTSLVNLNSLNSPPTSVTVTTSFRGMATPSTPDSECGYHDQQMENECWTSWQNSLESPPCSDGLSFGS